MLDLWMLVNNNPKNKIIRWLLVYVYITIIMILQAIYFELI